MMNRRTFTNTLIATTLLSSASALAAPIEVRIASHVSELSPLHSQSVMFANEIEKRLPGQFKFSFYPSAQLGKEKALITNVRAGSLEMINVASGIVKLDKKLGVFDLPWLFKDRAHVKRVMAGKLGSEIKALIETKNVKVIGMYENGFRHVLNTKRTIKSPRDLMGMKIRVSGGKFRRGVFSSMGVQPQSVPWKETFTALKTGVVDGAEAAAYGFYEQKQYEVSKYLSLTSHVYTPSFLVASTAFWNKLSAKQQKVFADVGMAITDKAYDKAAELENKYLAEMKSMIKVNDADLGAFQKATKKSYTNYIKENGDAWVKLVENAR